MKKVLFFILIPFLLSSCHKKNEQGKGINNGSLDSCGGYFIGIIPVSPHITNSKMTLARVNASTGQIITNYQNVVQVGNLAINSAPLGVYDHMHNCYYLYGSYSATKAILYVFNNSTGAVTMLGYPVFDTADGNYFFNSLTCNSTTGKLYFTGQDNFVNVIYEITPSANGFTQRLVFDTSCAFSSPVINEGTGYIYFFTATNTGGNTLMKVDPVIGGSSFVTNYHTGFAGLVYNNINYGLFYGLNPGGGTNNSTSLISISAVTGGGPSVIVDSVWNYNSGYIDTIAFDYCNNLYIVFGHPNIWIDPSTGKVVHQFDYQLPCYDVGVY